MTVFAGEPQPRGAVRIGRPRLYWRIWPGVSRATLLLDGAPIEARYDAERRAVVGQPPAPLAPGKHRVRCRVTFQSGASTEREWEFTVAQSGAFPTNPGNVAALAEINRQRQRLGLRLLTAEPSLDAAALAHARYLRRHRTGGHWEDPNRAGFVGADPATRARAFGFVDDMLTEDVAVQVHGGPAAAALGVRAAVAGLFDAPYHRLPFLNPQLTLAGTAIEADRGGACVVLLFGGSDDPGRRAQTLLSPFDGEQGVPTLWRGRETPDPLRLHERISGPVGYPIVLAHFPPRPPGRAPEPLRLDGARLRDAQGKVVPILINEPRSDLELGGQAVVLLPRQPLLHRQSYTVEISARDGGSGRSIGRLWRFTTGG